MGMQQVRVVRLDPYKSLRTKYGRFNLIIKGGPGSVDVLTENYLILNSFPKSISEVFVRET
jgi:hypothetical protein